MAEQSYLGYKATPGIDWGKLTSEFSQGLLDVSGRRAAQNIYFDNLYRENMSAVQEVEQSNDQDLNTIIQGAMSQVKDNAFDMNNMVKSGNMNHNEYRNFVNNTNSGITSFANTAKNLDATIQENIKRQQLDDKGNPQGSEYEEYLTESYSNLLNLRNKTMYQDPRTGKMFLANLGPDGLADLNTIQDASTLNKPMNIRDNYVDYNSVIANKVKTFGKIKIEELQPDKSTIIRSGISKMVDIKDKKGNVIGQEQVLNKNVADGIATTQNQIASNPRSVFNILKGMDERFDSYQDDAEKRSKMISLIDIENQSRINQGQPMMTDKETEEFASNNDMFLIPSSYDSRNELQPQPNADQVQMAKDWIKDTFYLQMDYTETLKAAPNKGKGGSTSTSKNNSKGTGYELYEDVYNAVSSGDTTSLKSLSGSEFNFTINSDNTLNVTEDTPDPRDPYEIRQTPVYTNATLDQIYGVFFGRSNTAPQKQSAEWERQKKAFYKATGKEKIAMNEGQTEDMPDDQMASLPQQQESDTFLSKLLKRGSAFTNRVLGNEQNIS
jgi:polyhydroxyalkanoate synthesis regulator phasin